jgi:acyl-CoA synthetase (AMP-forming)/AMP-acid ligase II
LLSHPSIIDVAVLGVDDVTWGQKVGVIVVFKSEADQLDLQQVIIAIEIDSNCWFPELAMDRKNKPKNIPKRWGYNIPTAVSEL